MATVTDPQDPNQIRLRAEYARLEAEQKGACARQVWHLDESLGADLQVISRQIQWTPAELQEKAHECLSLLAGQDLRMKRIPVSLTPAQHADLAALSNADGNSIASHIRTAVDAYLAQRRTSA